MSSFGFIVLSINNNSVKNNYLIKNTVKSNDSIKNNDFIKTNNLKVNYEYKFYPFIK